MTTILAAFAISLLLALALTPLVGSIGRRFGIVDHPSQRKIHTTPIPRIGGVAIYAAFALTIAVALIYPTDVSRKMLLHSSLAWCAAGATLVFLMGLADDVLPLPPASKFAGQILAASLAYTGGVRIINVSLPWLPDFPLHFLSFPVTVFWFLLVVNAINLIDGLDGLAAGVSFFVSLVLMVLALMAAKYDLALALAVLCGACMGFLRYNFNPASIFMGDAGSYFLGYSLAALSIVGAMKSQASVAMLIPAVALGLPLMDTLLAPIRRFITGRDMFRPDSGHIHHKLVRMGLTHRRSVLILYGVTVFFGVLALIMVNARDEKVGLLFFILAVVVILGFRKIGYLEYLAVDKMFGYFHDVTDVMGVSKERRTFLARQIAINDARNIDEMWQRIVDALELLAFDRAEMRFNGHCLTFHQNGEYLWCSRDVCIDPVRSEFRVLHLDLPLVIDKQTYGALHLYKDIMAGPISHYTLRRIEHLRRSIVRKLEAFQKEEKVTPIAEKGNAGQKNGVRRWFGLLWNKE